MKRSTVTYAQLDQVLRSLGFARRQGKNDPPGRIYQHESGAVVMLPAVRNSDRVYEYEMATVRTELDNFGIADSSVFAAELQKVG